MKASKAFVLSACVLLVGTVAAFAAAEAKPAVKPNTLNQEDISAGWILLFDGETPFGWKTEMDGLLVDKGALNTGSAKYRTAKTTTEFGYFNLAFEYQGDGVEVVLNGEVYPLPASKGGWMQAEYTVEPAEKGHKVACAVSVEGSKNGEKTSDLKLVNGPSRTAIAIRVPAQAKLELRNVKLKPLTLQPIFNGKDLTGWKAVDEQKHPSKFSVTADGELSIKNGSGDIQTEGQWDDFVLQLAVKSNGEHLNSGIFFRCLPGQFWQGYECQIRNEWKGYKKGEPRDEANEDRTKPVDCGTGGFYARVDSRKVVSNDHEWFTVTIVAHGNHLSAWVNGYQTADYTDNAKDAESARNGRRMGPGMISLQGHDPTTDLLFKNINVAELPRR